MTASLRLALTEEDGLRRASLVDARSGTSTPIGEGTPGPEGSLVAFLLPGVGDHHEMMAAGLYQRHQVFREALDECAEGFLPHLGRDIRHHLYPGGPAADPAPKRDTGFDLAALLGRAPASPLDATDIAQPVMFATGYALGALLGSVGVRPVAMAGHSIGEYVAACLAGVFTLADATAVVARRARLIEDAPPGAMLVALLGRPDLERYLEGDVWIAADDGPVISVAAGTEEAIARLEERLAADQVACRRVPARHAFHSPLLRSAADRLADSLAEVPLRPPEIPFLSNVTGKWITEEQATSPRYWGEHLVSPVRFASAVDELWSLGAITLVELGPGQALGSLAGMHPGRPAAARVLSMLPGPRHSRPDLAVAYETLGTLWISGAPLTLAD